MAGLPEVTVAGTLTADPELRVIPSGASVANFTVAADDRRYDNQTGTWVDGDATFLRCQAWRQLAENVIESLGKGTRVLVTGHLKQRSYQTPAGEKRTVFELAVTEIGASLKFATVTVRKATRSSGNGHPPSADPAFDAAYSALADGGLTSTGSDPDKPPF